MSSAIFILGSCVSRDVVRVTGHRFTVTNYTARQSIASAFSRPLETEFSVESAGSAFNQRSLQGDINSSAGKNLRRYAKESDALIIDIASDHWGITDVGKGSYLTLSKELFDSKLLDQIEHSRPIAFGSSKHFNLFRQGAVKLQQQLRAIDMFDKTLVLNTPLATSTREGRETPRSKSRTAAYWNECYPRYYSLLRELGFNIGEEPPADLILSTVNHKWGPAVYHYVDELYFWWANQIDSFIGSWER